MSPRNLNTSNSTHARQDAHKRTTKHREKELQMQTLYVIGTLTERRTPPAYFNFDGFDGMFPSLLFLFINFNIFYYITSIHQFKVLTLLKAWLHIGAIDRFPSSRTGYTFSCWLKVNYFLTDEAGLIGWQDTTKHCVFEVYFKTFIDAGMPLLS